MVFREYYFLFFIHRSYLQTFFFLIGILSSNLLVFYIFYINRIKSNIFLLFKLYYKNLHSIAAKSCCVLPKKLYTTRKRSIYNLKIYIKKNLICILRLKFQNACKTKKKCKICKVIMPFNCSVFLLSVCFLVNEKTNLVSHKFPKKETK